jgi:hypothetical protein
VNDIAQQIRDRLDDRAWRNLLRTAGGQVMHRAILAVLDLHKPEWNGGTQICWYCREGGPGYEAEPVAYPCDTVKTIAKALGIEAAT